MNTKEKKNFNQFYLDMMKLIETHSQLVPPHEVGFSMISAATTMMLQCSSNPIAVLKLANHAINTGIDEFEEEYSENPSPPEIWEKQ